MQDLYQANATWKHTLRTHMHLHTISLPVLTAYLPATCPCAPQNKIILDPLTFSEARFRPSLEERLESIISGAALMADSSCTRDDRRERIVAECNAVRQALQDLLSEYMNNVSLPFGFLFLLLNWHSWYIC